jgi:hypothetical protein
MSILKIANFIFFAILLNSINGQAQDTTEWTRGARLGCDISRFGLSLFQKGREAIEFSLDTEIKSDLFPAFELGGESAKQDNNRIKYKSNGLYARIGVDYNILGRDKLEKGRDIVYVGARYGFGLIKQQTDWYMVPGGALGDTITGSFPSANLSSHWLEGIFGLKVEVLHNLFLGASLRGKVLLFSKKNINYPFYMPGYGKGGNTSNFGITYSIYYQIPLMKVKPKIIKKEIKKLKK